MSAKPITGTFGVYLTPYSSIEASDLASPPDDVLNRLQIVPAIHAPKEWVQVGQAAIVVTLSPYADVVGAQVAALEKQIDETRAEAEVKALQLRRRINSLLAITNEVQA